MREIKFRAWDKVAKKFDYFSVVRSLDGEIGFIRQQVGITDREIFDHEYLQQYTGLKDKNGKEIYEGDIVTTGVFQDLDGKMIERRFNVEWKEKEGMWGLGNKGKITTFIFHSQDRWEVIGNIFSNPELL